MYKRQAWTFTCISQYILGICPTLDGLRIDPCIPEEMGGYTAERIYRGVKYHITVDNSAHVQKGVASVTVNGEPLAGNSILPGKGEKECHVVVVMGENSKEEN